MRTPVVTGFLAGALAGALVASAFPALAQFTSGAHGRWVAGSSLAHAHRDFQLGYVAGVDDGVQTAVAGGMPVGALTRQAECLAAHHSSLGLSRFADWVLTLPRGEAAPAAGLILRRACETEESAALYQATVIVTGYDMRSRPSGFAQTLRWVLVNVSGEPRLWNDPRMATLASHADRFVASFSYADQMAGIHYHDEQGTYDRPYYLTVKFVPERIDHALADLGERPWRGRHPVIVPVLSVRGFNGAAYLLSAESRAGADQRPAFAGVARDFHMQVRFPTEAELSAWGVRAGGVPTPRVTASANEAVVVGTLEFRETPPGWVGSWRWRRAGVDYTWSVSGVNYDEAFRDIVRGVLRLASGHRAPT